MTVPASALSVASRPATSNLKPLAARFDLASASVKPTRFGTATCCAAGGENKCNRSMAYTVPSAVTNAVTKATKITEKAFMGGLCAHCRPVSFLRSPPFARTDRPAPRLAACLVCGRHPAGGPTG